MISKSHRITNSSLALSKLNVQLTKAAHLQRQLIKKSWDLSMSHFIKHICLCHFTFALSEFLSVMLCCAVLCSFFGGVLDLLQPPLFIAGLCPVCLDTTLREFLTYFPGSPPWGGLKRATYSGGHGVNGTWRFEKLPSLFKT